MFYLLSEPLFPFSSSLPNHSVLPPPEGTKPTIMFVVSLPRLIRFVLWPLLLQNSLQVAIKSLKFTWLLEGAKGSGRCWEYFNWQRKQLKNGILLLLYCRVIMRSGIYSTAFKHGNSDNSCTGLQSAIEGGLTSVIFLSLSHCSANQAARAQLDFIW